MGVKNSYLNVFRHESFSYVATTILTIVVTWFALNLREANWFRPWSYISDAVLPQSSAKTVIETGWYEFQPLLNAPHGQVMHDYKVADNFWFLFVKFLAIFTDNPYFVVNIYFFIGFVLAAITALWFFRLIGVSKLWAIVLSVLYAITPYHFARGEIHLILSAYWPLPLAFGIVYLIIRGKQIWIIKNPGGKMQLWGAGSGVMTATVLVLIATANNYYAFFTLLFIAFFGLSRFIFTRQWKTFTAAIGAGLVVFVTMILNMLPDILYTRENGPNFEAVQRIPYGVEFYSLRLTELLLPVPGHRISAFDTLRNFYMTAFNVGGEQPVLGAVASVGFLSLIVFGMAMVVYVNRNKAATETSKKFRALTGMSFFGFLLGTIGGFSSIIGLFTSDLRGWNRISILLALLGLSAVGLGLTILAQKINFGTTTKGKVLSSISSLAAAGLLLTVGYFDQVTPGSKPYYSEINIAFEQDQTMVERISDLVGENASIVQLPYRDFPESPGPVPDTEQLKPYMHSSTLHWTSGGIKGRPTSEWVYWLEQMDSSDLVVSALSAGFSGILLDRAGITEETKALEVKLKNFLGNPSFESHEGRFAFFDLKNIDLSVISPAISKDIQEEIGYLVTNPVGALSIPSVTTMFHGLDLLKPYKPHLLIDNPQINNADIEVTFSIANVVGKTRVAIVYGGRTLIELDTSLQQQDVRLQIEAVPGRSQVDFVYLDGAEFPNRIGQQSPLEITGLTTKDLKLHSILEQVRG